MEFGVHVHVTAHGLGAVDAGRLAEDAGFDAIFLADHTHIPADVEQAHPMAVEHFSRFYDQLTALAAIGATTRTLKLGTGVCLVNQRDPIALAKATATVDDLSGGRLIFGVGAGGNPDEMRNHGVDPATKFSRMGDCVRAIKAIWTSDVAEHHGPFVDFGPLYSWPKPRQRPHPPILLAGNGPRALERVFDYADGWCPAVNGGLEGIRARTAQVREFRRRAADVPDGDRRTIVAIGCALEDACVDALRKLGVDQCCFGVPPGTADEIRAGIERAARLAERHR